MASEKLSFILGVHCHQPVGNFGWVIEEAFEKSYRPFIEALADYPQLRVTAHYSGPLLEWIAENRPRFLDTLSHLVMANRMEIIGSGFYEPILMTIPTVDRLEQIEIMEQWVEDRLGMRPKGIWLTERIWEPSLPRTLQNAGVYYTVVDDSHFIQAGIPREKVSGYFTTEDEGQALAVFPIDQTLRYAVPFKSPEETLAYLRARFEAGDRSCITLIDDGEKFGVWPGTYELLYSGEGWLKRFFDLLVSNADWLDVTTPSAYMDAHPSQGLVYLPTTSYFEMSQWTLAPRDNITLETMRHRLEAELGGRQEVFLKGGFFRNFFTRYPETNHMHKRMLEVSNKVHLSALEGQPRDIAKRALFRAQCNCAYWHGIFGGLYLPHLRDAIYENLLLAERIVEDRDLATEHYDLDFDGHKEFVLRNRRLAAFFAPADGGTLIELDSYPHAANLTNTLSRYEEAYHITAQTTAAPKEGDTPSIHDMNRSLSAEERELLVYDAYRRSSFRDALLPQSTAYTPEQLRDLDLSTTPGGLPALGYTARLDETENEAGLSLTASASLAHDLTLDIHKRASIQKDGNRLRVRYTLTPKGHGSFYGKFAVQLNLSAPSALGIEEPFAVDGKLLPAHPLLKAGSRAEATSFSLKDPHRKFVATVTADRPLGIVWHPLQTISQSEAGFDRNYQASTLWLLLPVSLTEDGGPQELEITLTIDDSPH